MTVVKKCPLCRNVIKTVTRESPKGLPLSALASIFPFQRHVLHDKLRLHAIIEH